MVPVIDNVEPAEHKIVSVDVRYETALETYQGMAADIIQAPCRAEVP